MRRLYAWFKTKDNREIFALFGGAFAVVAGGLWTVFVYFDEDPRKATYKNEVAAFSENVDASVQAFQSLVPQYTTWATEKRDEQLLRGFASDQIKPSTSDGCEALRMYYESRFAKRGASASDYLTAEDYADCQVTPVPRVDPDVGLRILNDVGAGLKLYAAGLAAVTEAEDEAALEDAVFQLNLGAKSFLASVNKTLNYNNRGTLDDVRALVYRLGRSSFSQHRFDILKQTVNDYDQVVDRAANILAEVAFSVYGPTLIAKKKALNNAENKAISVTDGDFVRVWIDIKKALDAYFQAFRDSPVYDFAGIKITHRALRNLFNTTQN